MGSMFRFVLAAFLVLSATGSAAAECGEESRSGCETCADGIDNDGDGLTDAEDPGCATLAEYQRVAIVETKPAELRQPGDALPVSSVLLPGGLLGDPVDGRCAAGATCVCPQSAPECQALGRPCAEDQDCAAAPFPLGRSHATVADDDEEQESRVAHQLLHDDLVARAKAIARIPGSEIDPIDATDGDGPLHVTFERGKQIIDVAFVRLASETQLVLTGEADTTLVIRVHGDLELGEGASVMLAGGLSADRVLWTLLGTDGRVLVGPRAELTGTILAPERDAVELGEGIRIRGAILGSEVRFVTSPTKAQDS